MSSTIKMETPDLVILCTVLNEAKAHIMQGFLESEGIPCQLENVSFHAEPAPVLDLMQVQLLVLRKDADEARRLLRKRESIQVCFCCAAEVDKNDKVCLHCGERLGE